MKKITAVMLAVLIILAMSSCRTVEVIGEIIDAAGQLADRSNTEKETTAPTESPTQGETTEPTPTETTAQTTKVPEKATAQTTKAPEVTTQQQKTEATTKKSDEPAPLAAVKTLDLSVQRYTKSDWDSDKQYLNAYHDLITLGSEDSKSYPKLASAFKSLNSESMKEVDDTEAAAKKDAKGNPNYICFEQTDAAVVRADNRIVSLLTYEYSFSGGAHPNESHRGINYDPETGKELKLSDVYSDIKGLPGLIIEQLKLHYTDGIDDYDSIGKIIEKYSEEDYIWTIGYQSLTVYFAPGELVSRALGEMVVNIWFDESDKFVSKYTEAPKDGYAVSLLHYNTMYFDLDPKDGKRDHIQFSADKDPEGGSYNSINIRVNGKDCYFKDYLGYEANPYLVYANGKYYAYVECCDDVNGFSVLCIYSIANGTAKFEEALYGFGFIHEYADNTGVNYSMIKHIFTDPTDVMMSRNIDLFGSRAVTSQYKIGTDGKPGSTTNLYTAVFSGDPMKAKVSVTVTMNDTKKEQFMPAGTEFYFVSTDYKTYAELKLADGRLCRVKLDSVNPNKINGKLDFDTFEYDVAVG